MPTARFSFFLMTGFFWRFPGFFLDLAMVKPVFHHLFCSCSVDFEDRFFFDIWNRSGTLKYLKDAVEIIAVSSSVQKLFKKKCVLITFWANFDDVWIIFKLKRCLNGCDSEHFEDTSRPNFSRRTRCACFQVEIHSRFLAISVPTSKTNRSLVNRTGRENGWELASRLNFARI